MERKPKIAILRWGEGLVPQGLMQLEELPGNSTNPKSYPFPVRMIHVPGACVETVITHPSQELLENMISICKKLRDEEGILAISTSCGFNAVFQQKLAEGTKMPIFSSSLLQVPFVQNIIGKNRTVAVLTANKGALTKEHFHACGITDDMHVEVIGLENAKEWSKIFDEPDEAFDMQKVQIEIVSAAEEAVRANPEIGAFVLECTDLPPFARKISETTGLPVFDFVSMMSHVAIALGELPIYERRI